MIKIVAQLTLFAVLAVPSYAEGWLVNRVRGTAEYQVSGRWIPLERGAVIVDGQRLKTGADGRAGLIRGAETVELEPGTQILLHEGVGNMTSIEQASGLINVDVERRNVQHFSIQTPFLAAVVKGTRFTVSVGDDASHVTVDRGVVQVQDNLNDLVVDIVPGQEAEVSKADPLIVTGGGSVAVFTFEGERVVNGTADTPADDKGRAVGTATSETRGSSGDVRQNSGNMNNGNGNAAGNGKSDDNRGNANSGNDKSNGNSGNNDNSSNSGNNSNVGNGANGGNNDNGGNSGNNDNSSNSGNNSNGGHGSNGGNGNVANNDNRGNSGNNGNGSDHDNDDKHEEEEDSDDSGKSGEKDDKVDKDVGGDRNDSHDNGHSDDDEGDNRDDNSGNGNGGNGKNGRND